MWRTTGRAGSRLAPTRIWEGMGAPPDCPFRTVVHGARRRSGPQGHSARVTIAQYWQRRLGDKLTIARFRLHERVLVNDWQSSTLHAAPQQAGKRPLSGPLPLFLVVHDCSTLVPVVIEAVMPPTVMPTPT